MTAKIIQFLRCDKRSTLLFCFYSFNTSDPHSHPSVFILTTLVSQILRQNHKLSAFVYENFVAEGLSPSIQNLKGILQDLIPQLDSPRVVVDGIDECIQYDKDGKPQDLRLLRAVLDDVLDIQSRAYHTVPIKLFVVSREVVQLVSKLSKKPTLALNNENAAIQAAIRIFAHQRLSEIQRGFDTLCGVDSMIERTENTIVAKSDGTYDQSGAQKHDLGSPKEPSFD